ncbi:MAG: EamA family transporter [Coriobacteriia bacterium]|nr:EamA family transporter [Coriobacteriia bacterium]
MSELALYILIAVGSVILSSISQMMLKISANKTYPSRVAEYLNPLVLSGYTIFFLTTLIMVYAYRVIPLSIGPIIEALGYVFIAIIGFAILREKITRKKLLGMLLIIAGVVMSSITL